MDDAGPGAPAAFDGGHEDRATGLRSSALGVAVQARGAVAEGPAPGTALSSVTALTGTSPASAARGGGEDHGRETFGDRGPEGGHRASVEDLAAGQQDAGILGVDGAEGFEVFGREGRRERLVELGRGVVLLSPVMVSCSCVGASTFAASAGFGEGSARVRNALRGGGSPRLCGLPLTRHVCPPRDSAGTRFFRLTQADAGVTIHVTLDRVVVVAPNKAG